MVLRTTKDKINHKANLAVCIEINNNNNNNNNNLIKASWFGKHVDYIFQAKQDVIETP